MPLPNGQSHLQENTDTKNTLAKNTKLTMKHIEKLERS